MNINKTDVIFILDASGSMHGMEKDTIGGYNSFLEKQKREEGDCFISTYLFNSTYRKLVSNTDIKNVGEMTENDYQTRGCTALLDTLGEAMKNEESFLVEIKDDRNVIFVIITDGLENASRKYNLSQIKEMVEDCQRKGWNFIFLGANMDAFNVASNIGINKKFAANYVNTSNGVSENFIAVDKAVNMFRACGTINDDWKQGVDDLYNQKTSK